MVQNQASNEACWVFTRRDLSLAESVIENLSKAAASLPGYGQPDCFYPDSFLGTWDVTREVVGVVAPAGDAAVECPQVLQVSNWCI